MHQPVLHLRRANYQCHIWKRACNKELNFPSPVGNGWLVTDGMLHHELIINSPVLDCIVELVRCKYKKACQNNLCSCLKVSLPCTEACLCNDNDECQNTAGGEDASYDSSSNEDYRNTSIKWHTLNMIAISRSLILSLTSS